MPGAVCRLRFYKRKAEMYSLVCFTHEGEITLPLDPIESVHERLTALRRLLHAYEILSDITSRFPKMYVSHLRALGAGDEASLEEEYTKCCLDAQVLYEGIREHSSALERRFAKHFVITPWGVLPLRGQHQYIRVHGPSVRVDLGDVPRIACEFAGQSAILGFLYRDTLYQKLLLVRTLKKTLPLLAEVLAECTAGV